MNAQSTLTKASVVDQLAAQLVARRTPAARRNAAYHRLAQQVLDTTDRALRLQIVPTPIRDTVETAA
jgi:hypothetical protein